MKNSNNKSSRYLTPYQYFEVVQIEWIVAELRRKIYVKKEDREFWKKVAEGKRVTIENISQRNRLPNIFTDLDLLSSLERRIYREETYPLFIYKDEETKLSQEYLDLLYYYYPNTEVSFLHHSGEWYVGKVVSYKSPLTSIVISYEGENYTLNIKSVRRIL